jgi:hypothetical protein
MVPCTSAWQLKLEAEQGEGFWEGDYCEGGDQVVVLVEAPSFQSRVRMTVEAKADGARVSLQHAEQAITHRGKISWTRSGKQRLSALKPELPAMFLTVAAREDGPYLQIRGTDLATADLLKKLQQWSVLKVASNELPSTKINLNFQAVPVSSLLQIIASTVDDGVLVFERDGSVSFRMVRDGAQVRALMEQRHQAQVEDLELKRKLLEQLAELSQFKGADDFPPIVDEALEDLARAYVDAQEFERLVALRRHQLALFDRYDARPEQPGRGYRQLDLAVALDLLGDHQAEARSLIKQALTLLKQAVDINALRAVSRAQTLARHGQPQLALHWLEQNYRPCEPENAGFWLFDVAEVYVELLSRYAEAGQAAAFKRTLEQWQRCMDGYQQRVLVAQEVAAVKAAFDGEHAISARTFDWVLLGAPKLAKSDAWQLRLTFQMALTSYLAMGEFRRAHLLAQSLLRLQFSKSEADQKRDEALLSLLKDFAGLDAGEEAVALPYLIAKLSETLPEAEASERTLLSEALLHLNHARPPEGSLALAQQLESTALLCIAFKDVRCEDPTRMLAQALKIRLANGGIDPIKKTILAKRRALAAKVANTQ